MVNHFHMHSSYGDVDVRHQRIPSISRLMRWDKLHNMEWISYTSLHCVLPLQAVECGRNGKNKLYLARAVHQGSFTPGYLDASKKCCYIPWGGKMHAKKRCEVLCTPGEFVPCTDTNTLLNATPAGISEQGEPLHFGRVIHNGKLIIGKVQRSHDVCYVPCNGKEQHFKDYDVFIKSSVNPVILCKDNEHLILKGMGIDSQRWPQNYRVPNLLRRIFQRHNNDEHWVVVAGGQIPPNAVVGGRARENLYIGRARHEGSITPGMVLPSQRSCTVVWGGAVWLKTEFQVLCNVNGAFVPASGSDIPPNSFPAGESEDGERLFVGRVNHEGTAIIGKVQPLHGVCYIPYDGNELSFSDYEIYVTP